MPLHPLARKFVDDLLARPPLETLSVADARGRIMEMTQRLGPGEPVHAVRDVTAPGPGGPLTIRLYTPAGAGPFPVYVFFHGGGWVVGNLETTDFHCRALTNLAGCMIASVNYRHAPEHRFPAAAEDAFAATRWIAEQGGTLGIDTARIAVGGSSAGSNLAAVAAIMSRDRGGPAIRCQVLSVPITDYNFETPSYRDNADGYGLTRAAMQWFWAHYLGPDQDGTHPHASPLRADLRNLPAAMVLTAEFDPLRDEGEAYARRLQESGVEVSARRYEGMVHMFLGPEALPDIAAFLRRHLDLPA